MGKVIDGPGPANLGNGSQPGQHPKAAWGFEGADRRVMRRQTLSTGSYRLACGSGSTESIQAETGVPGTAAGLVPENSQARRSSVTAARG